MVGVKVAREKKGGGGGEGGGEGYGQQPNKLLINKELLGYLS